MDISHFWLWFHLLDTRVSHTNACLTILISSIMPSSLLFTSSVIIHSISLLLLTGYEPG